MPETLSRAHFSVADLNDKDDADEYWRSRTFAERLAHIEYLRKVNFGDLAQQRLQRIFEVVDFPQS